MAIIIIAPRSSIMAKAVKNIFNETGTLLPNKERIPKANAISVAIGMPKPDWATVPLFIIKCIKAGAIIPPMAAKKGNEAFLSVDNSPI